MMISPVSFGSVAASNMSFEDRIRQPQQYGIKEQPAASSPIDKTHKKGGKAGKVVLGGTAIAAIVMTALALLSTKTQAFSSLEGKFKNEIVQKAIKGLNQAGYTIAEAAVQAKDFVLKQVKKIPNLIHRTAQAAPIAE